jgi:hypothetical protein
MVAAESLVPMLAFASVMDLAFFVAATETRQWDDESDALFVYVFTFITSLITIILSAGHNMLTYTWVGVGVLLAMMAYTMRLASKREYS